MYNNARRVCEIKPDIGGLRGIKGQNGWIKAGRAGGHPLSPEEARIDKYGPGMRGISRIKWD
jgi:hypothetical protein